MTGAALSEHVLRSVLKKAIDRGAATGVPVGIWSASPWTGASALDVGGARYRVEQADSVLAFRWALHRRPAGAGLVVITPLGGDSLGDDALARLFQRRLQTVQLWRLVHGLFGAREADPRLRDAGAAVAEALIAAQPPQGYRPVPGHYLDEETAWRNVAEHVLGFEDGTLDTISLVQWALGEHTIERYQHASAGVRAATRGWFERRLGPPAQLVFGLLDGPHAERLGALLLLSELLGHKNPQTRDLSLKTALLFDGVPNEVRPRAFQSVTSALEALRGRDHPHQRAARARDALVKKLDCASALGGSHGSPQGFLLRQADLASALATSDTRRCWRAFLALREHQLASPAALRLERWRMMVRLHGWLQTVEPKAGTPEAALAAYEITLSWVDRARAHLAAGDVGQRLKGASADLLERARARREGFNERFARRLARWLGDRPAHSGLVGIEAVLDQAVVPVLRQPERPPVLLLVLDGLSWPVAHDLLDAATEWIAVEGPVRSAVTTAPSVTQLGRTSLLNGTLLAGQQSDERSRFPALAAWRPFTTKTRPPQIFHKKHLAEGRDLDRTLARVGDPRFRVVGVVVNAIDDQLDGADQLTARWSFDVIKPLRSVLEAASAAERVVVLTSDHGHVWSDGAPAAGPQGEAQRWRRGTPERGERLLEGPAIERLMGGPVVVPWSESIHYLKRAAGYHGGITPQELLVPVITLYPVSRAESVDKTLARTAPAFWHPPARSAPPKPAPPPPIPRPAPPAGATRPQMDLFVAPAATSVEAPGPSWGARLIASGYYQEIRAGRPDFTDAQVARLIDLLADRSGGRAQIPDCARVVGVGEGRLPGFVYLVQRALNADGVQVLVFEQASGAVRLDVDLLAQQFELT